VRETKGYTPFRCNLLPPGTQCQHSESANFIMSLVQFKSHGPYL